MKLIGLSCGRKNGNSEMLLKESMMAAQEVADIEVEIIRLLDFDLNPCTGCESCTLSMMQGGDGLCRVHKGKDDMFMLRDKFVEADGMIIAAPVFCLTAPGHLKVMHERFLGYGPEFLMSVFESSKIKPKIGATIAVGGTDWTHPALPLMNIPLFMLQYSVVDQLLVNWVARPGHVLLKDEEMAKARRLGQRVGSSMGKPVEELRYLGDDPGVCPMCHSNMMMLSKKRQVVCPICDITGELSIENDEVVVSFSPEAIRHGRWFDDSMRGHFGDVLRQHKIFNERKAEVKEKGKKYRNYAPYLKAKAATTTDEDEDGDDSIAWAEALQPAAQSVS